MRDNLASFDKCLYKELPFCAGACPFSYDVTEFISRVNRGHYASAFRLYRDAVAFPRIVSAICPQPCKSVCPRKNVDSAIELAFIERSVISKTEDTAPNRYNVPERGKRIAVIGSGIGGLGCALRLAAMNYHVEVFESESIIGSAVRNVVGNDLFELEIEEQFRFVDVVFNTESDVSAATAIDKHGFDAVYKASYSGDVFSLAHGLLVSKEIDAYLRTGLINGSESKHGLWKADKKDTEPFGRVETAVSIHELRLRAASDSDISDVFKASEDIPGKSLKYRVSEASANDTSDLSKEAARCLLCKCDACRILCDITDYFGKWPQRIRDEVFATTLPGSAEVKATPAKRLMSTCNLCGVCAEVCPINIDMDALILNGRRSMHRQEKAPWAFHDFWVKDMLHANSKETRIARMPSNSNKNEMRMAFFPGCQLCAEDPRLVLRVYNELSSIFHDIGIITRCCGAPAEWSGDEEKHKQSLAEFKADWIDMGKPVLLAACPTCVKELAEHLPKIPVTTVYEKLSDTSTSIHTDGTSSKCIDSEWAVFDPCSAGNSPELKASVRSLAESIGIKLGALPVQDEVARCCGYGGQPEIADPTYAKFVADKRISESKLPYITYCINCREAFMREGKKTVHILELLFPEDEIHSGGSKPTVTQRRQNRVILKKKLLEELWGENMEVNEKDYGFDLIISDELRKKLDSKKMLEEEVCEAIAFALKSGRFVIDETTGAKSAYHKIGYMTYWVTFNESNEMNTDGRNEITLLNAYSHRMSIDLEPVWNGVKVETEE